MIGLNLIATRRQALLTEKAEIVARLEAIEREEAELDSAERTLARLEREQRVQKGKVLIVGPVHFDEPETIPRKGTKRPEGAPTTPAMIDAVLAKAEAEGKAGLVGKDMVLAIRRDFWPGIGWTPVLPELNRLIKAKRIRKEGRLFVRVKKSEGSGARATEPSLNL